MALELVKEWKSFGGVVRRYRHTSTALGGLPAVFSVILPPAALALGAAPVPGIVYLSGLTCTDDNVITKAGAQRACAAHGVALICPDTSPRGANLGPEETAAWDFGAGAGFYVDATQAPWAAHYRMYTYVTEELPALLAAAAGELRVDAGRLGITGHSMGGLGALQIGLKRPGVFRSVSAFAPICHPSACPWGVKAFTGYLGARGEGAAVPAAWAEYDPTELVAAGRVGGGTPARPLHVLIDQGGDDGFLKDGQLRPEDLVAAAAGAGPAVRVEYRLQAGYDHSYFFIATFIDDHVAHHARALKEQL